ncbi:MAG TPA: glycosyltransferase [Opitutaceae bacterium]|nr:glycosyltransferase [Opitutaceae bacterium]
MSALGSPYVTVAIPTYNRSAFLRQTLEGLSRQRPVTGGFEIIVIDNNSRDDTRSVVAEFSEASPAPQYVVETQQGLDHARNRAVHEAKGEILILADDDILMDPDWVTQLVAPFRADSKSKIAAVGGEVIPVFPDGLPEWVAEWHSPLAFRAETGPLTAQQSPMGANLAFRKSVFERHGLFSTTLDRKGSALFSGGETEMLNRLRQAGLEVWFAPAAKVKHQMPASRTTFRYAARHAFDSARSRVVDRGRTSIGYLVSRLLANALKVLVYSLIGILWALLLQTGNSKKAWVRAWRSCGYLYQIPRTAMGKI